MRCQDSRRSREGGTPSLCFSESSAPNVGGIKVVFPVLLFLLHKSIGSLASGLLSLLLSSDSSSSPRDWLPCKIKALQWVQGLGRFVSPPYHYLNISPLARVDLDKAHQLQTLVVWFTISTHLTLLFDSDRRWFRWTTIWSWGI